MFIWFFLTWELNRHINLTQKKDVILALRLEINRSIVQEKDMCTSFLFNLCNSQMKSNKNGYGFCSYFQMNIRVAWVECSVFVLSSRHKVSFAAYLQVYVVQCVSTIIWASLRVIWFQKKVTGYCLSFGKVNL